MARAGIIYGLLLCGLTCAGLLVTTAKSPIQFIPMVIGIPTLFCGVVALNPHRRKHAMRAATILALVGATVGGSRSMALVSRWLRDQSVDDYEAYLNSALWVTSGGFLIVALIAYWQDRRRRHQLRRRAMPTPQASPARSDPRRESA